MLPGEGASHKAKIGVRSEKQNGVGQYRCIWQHRLGFVGHSAGAVGERRTGEGQGRSQRAPAAAWPQVPC